MTDFKGEHHLLAMSQQLLSQLNSFATSPAPAKMPAVVAQEEESFGVGEVSDGENSSESSENEVRHTVGLEAMEPYDIAVRCPGRD